MTEERLEMLMVKATDNVATSTEREELMAYIADKPALQKELSMHEGLKAVTDGWVHRLEVDLANDRYHRESLTVWWTNLGLTLFLGGTAVLLGGGMAEVLAEPDVPMWLKVGYSGMGAGFLVLLAAVIRWRVTTAKHDKYTEVVR